MKAIVWDRSPSNTPNNAKIAQLVEHRSEESGVVGSIPTLGTNIAPVDKLAKSSLSKGEI